MAIREEVTQDYFIKEFKKIRKDNFSNRGLEALYLYLTELSEDMGEDIELDVIAICCDYAEYDSLKECLEHYSDINSLDKLNEYTTVIELEDSKGVIIQQF
tara:strand:+ start:199 stop:501 length:303 start_codon:yes stop_codon:yes gene_type:complete